MEKAVEIDPTRYERLPRLLKVVFLIFTTVGVGLAVFHLFGFSVCGLAMLDIGYYFLLFSLFLSSAFLLLPARKKDKVLPWYDLVAAVLIFGLSVYFFKNAWAIGRVGWVPPSTFNLALACIYCLLILEGGRRMAGNIYLAICVVLGLYPLYAGYMPGVFGGLSFPFRYTMALLTFGTEGILGLPAQVVGSILIGFLIFAGILIASGAGQFMLNIALSLLGRFRGGPAKVAVLGSGFFGSLSGSVFANIASTGSVTIPTMKRLGYPAHYAGAIEACASTGGVLMPPVMGAIAFVMAMVLGMDYYIIMLSAVIPAILYYFGLLMQVDAYAARVGLKGLPREEIPPLKKTLKEGWPFIAVLFFLVWGLVYMRWAAMAPFYASALMLLLSFSSRATMITPRRFIQALIVVGRLLASTMAVVLPIGFVIAGLNVTGISAAFAAKLVTFGGGNIYLLFLMGIAACYMMGMVGMGVVAYIVLAITLAPAVISLAGLNPLSVHLLIAYYSMLSMITPPVAVGAFFAATMAGASPMKTALLAMRLGVVIYFIPIFFVFNSALVLQGPILDTVYLFILCLLGIGILAGGLEGYLIKVGRLELWARPFLVVAGLLIAFPEWRTTIIGALLGFLVIAIMLLTRRGRLVATERVEQREARAESGKCGLFSSIVKL